MDISLESVVRNLSWVKNGTILTDFDRRLFKLSAFYILFLLCVGIGVDPEPIRRFWSEVGIHSTLGRFNYILDHHETLVYRGPIIVMAYMTIVQTNKKFSRGVYWDSLHTFYLAYVDLMLSEDKHFVDLKEALPPGPIPLKIHKPSEMHWERHKRENLYVDPWLA